eukprot:GHVL01004480.1.p1 GENE.GHVL01004480.1~~GHVL01004480.1.p1  ORF type:complete len:290 (-),score=39.61 GHVL01004480.1:12-881(-)
MQVTTSFTASTNDSSKSRDLGCNNTTRMSSQKAAKAARSPRPVESAGREKYRLDIGRLAGICRGQTKTNNIILAVSTLSNMDEYLITSPVLKCTPTHKNTKMLVVNNSMAFECHSKCSKILLSIWSFEESTEISNMTLELKDDDSVTTRSHKLIKIDGIMDGTISLRLRKIDQGLKKSNLNKSEKKSLKRLNSRGLADSDHANPTPLKQHLRNNQIPTNQLSEIVNRLYQTSTISSRLQSKVSKRCNNQSSRLDNFRKLEKYSQIQNAENEEKFNEAAVHLNFVHSLRF